MHEKRVSNTLEPQERFIIFIDNRLLAEICTGHYEHINPVIEEQDMQWCIRKHNTKPVVERRN